MLDVVLYEVFKEEEVGIRKFLPADLKVRITPKTIQEEGETDCPSALISTRTQSEIPQSWSKTLKGILTRSAGYDHISAYKESVGEEIICGYLPDYCSRAVAEQAILNVMALLRKLQRQTNNFNTFKRDDITGYECFSKNILVVGVGRIGSQIVQIAEGLGMKIKGVDVEPKAQEIEYVTLREGVCWAQIIVSAVPLTEQTRGMFTYAVLKSIQNPGIFVNISRGETSPIEDLRQLLSEGVLSGVGMDVFEDEKSLAHTLRERGTPQDDKHKALLSLQGKDNVILTPHNAFNTYESVDRKAAQSVEAINSFLKDNVFPCLIPHSPGK